MKATQLTAANRQYKWALDSWTEARTMWNTTVDRLKRNVLDYDQATCDLRDHNVIRGQWSTFLASQSLEQPFDFVSRSWTTFLLHANRVFSKLEQGSKGGACAHWYGQIKRQRRQDSLLSYVHHARNAGEHGNLAISVHDVIISGFQPRVALTFTQQSLATGGPSSGITFVPPFIRLLPVVDRSVRYEPPVEHLGRTFVPTFENVGDAMSNYLSALLKEARSRVSAP